MEKHTWEKIERVAKQCQRTWGMGFPVISLALLDAIMKGATVDERHITRDPARYLSSENGTL